MEVLYNSSQFFTIILTILWLYFCSLYFDNKDMILGLIIFGLSIPLSIVIAIISLSFHFGFIIVFLIPILSLYLLTDSIYYSNDKKKKR